MTEKVILLVDDEPGILSALRRALRYQGNTLIAVSSGQQGLAVLEQQDVHLVISDYRMPRMMGDVFLAQVREAYPLVRRIMLSGYSSLDDANDVVVSGIAELLLRKPWEIGELRSAVKDLLTND